MPFSHLLVRDVSYLIENYDFSHRFLVNIDQMKCFWCEAHAEYLEFIHNCGYAYKTEEATEKNCICEMVVNRL